MYVTGLLRSTLLLLCIFLESLATKPQLQLEELRRVREELVNVIASLDWIIGLFQLEPLFLFALRHENFQLLLDMDNCEVNGDNGRCLVEAVNKLFNGIMKSNSKASKINALQAVDRFLNSETIFYLIETHSNSFNGLASTILFLTVDGFKPIDKNCDTAKTVLDTKHRLNYAVAADQSIWFILNQLEFYKNSFSKFDFIKENRIADIVWNKIVLRADVNLEALLKSMNQNIKTEEHEDFHWYNFKIEKSPFEDTQLYGIQDCWELLAKSLLLEDPVLVARLLDDNLPAGHEETIDYLLLLRENPVKLLARIELKRAKDMYCCFALMLDVDISMYAISCLRKTIKERLAEVADNLLKLKEKDMLYMSEMQLEYPYLSFASIFGKDNGALNIEYINGSTQDTATLELLDVIGDTAVEQRRFWGKPFNKYLTENPDWDEAVDKHFRHFISNLIIDGQNRMLGNIVKYFGIEGSIQIDNTLSLFDDFYCRTCVSCTLDKIPRHLNNYLEIIDGQVQAEKISLPRRFKIAICGSMFSEETASASYREHFARYQIEELYLHTHSTSPVYVDFINTCHKATNREIEAIEPFLHFENLVYNYYSSSLARMDLERGLQRLLINNRFSAALKEFVTNNFQRYMFPFTLVGLQRLKDELLKHYPEIALRIQIERIPVKVLFRIVYETLGDTFDLGFSLARRLLNAQMIHTRLV